MKISKEYHWEMGHRLPFHNGLCKNLHGHSYKAIITVEGNPDNTGILIDFYDLDSLMKPLLEKMDHGFILSESDMEVISFFKKINSKHFVVPFHSTAENISRYITIELKTAGFPDNITSVSAEVFETADASAFSTLELL